ncbi:MAG: type VII toxin-antitoxin system MntA family adenylyltransferase antitoxin [Gaiellaceae bacterium]
MTRLDSLAQEVGVHGRTLRRAAGRGLLKASRQGSRTVVLPASERSYVRIYWPLIAGLLETLRKQPNIRLAVLFGSVARGEAGQKSDLDLLVELRRDDYLAHAEVAAALEDATGRRVQTVTVNDAARAPLLLADVLRDGRVLVDRDDRWPMLKRRERAILASARRDDARRQRLAWEAPDALEEIGRRRVSVADG